MIDKLEEFEPTLKTYKKLYREMLDKYLERGEEVSKCLNGIKILNEQITHLTDRLTTAKKYTNHIGVCHFFESDKECTCGYDDWLQTESGTG